MIWLQQKYINLLSNKLLKFKQKTNNPYSANFRCPYCGDSKKNPNKARGNIYTKEGKLFYICFNCGVGRTIDNFIKDQDEQLYNEYRLELIKENKPIRKNKKEIKLEFNTEEKFSSINWGFKTLLESGNKEAIDYISSRKIPFDRFEDILYCDNLKKMENVFPKYKDKLPESSRIIFPLYNEYGIVGCQARDIKEKKYHTLLPDGHFLFGLNKIDENKKIKVLEGPIDSLFLENAVAVCSADLTKATEFFRKELLVLISDNQPRNREIVKIIMKMAKKGFSMVVWPSEIKEKDINDMVLAGIEDIEDIINKNTFSGLELIARLNNWKKI